MEIKQFPLKKPNNGKAELYPLMDHIRYPLLDNDFSIHGYIVLSIHGNNITHSWIYSIIHSWICYYPLMDIVLHIVNIWYYPFMDMVLRINGYCITHSWIYEIIQSCKR